MIINTPANNNQTVISRETIFELRESNSTLQKSLHSSVHFNSNDVICSFSAREVLEKPTYLTVQTGITTHITLGPEYLQYINHSCNPNVFFDTASFQIISLKEIEPDDELTFFYPSTEWKMIQPFNCYCGSSDCLLKIQGAYYLDNSVLQRYRLSDFILQQINQFK